MIGFFSCLGCLANLSENPGMLVTTGIEKGGTWLPCPSSCKSLEEKLWGKCLSFPSGSWGSGRLSTCQLCNVGCLLKAAFFCRCQAAVPRWHSCPLGTRPAGKSGTNCTSMGRNLFANGGKASICPQGL